MKKRVLVLAKDFYPDQGTSANLNLDICRALAEHFDVQVVASVPCYNGKVPNEYQDKRYYSSDLDGMKLLHVRVPSFDKTNKLSRIYYIVNYYLSAKSAIKKMKKFDVIMTISQPPILGGLLGLFAKNIAGGKLIYNVQDYNPEQSMAVGYLPMFLLKIAQIIDVHTCRNTDMVITIGEDMRQTLHHRCKGKKVPPCTIIHNWIDEEAVYPLDKSHEKIKWFRQKYGLDDRFVIMYSGNIGLYYDLDNILQIMGEFKKRDDVCFAFVGMGAAKERLEQYALAHQLNNVCFIPYQDKDDLIYSLNAADVHLVSNAKGIKGVSVPSKLYGVMATNVPVLGVMERDCEAWLTIEKSGCGVLCEVGDNAALKAALNRILTEKQVFVKQHETGRLFLEKYLTKAKALEAYVRCIEKVVGG